VINKADATINVVGYTGVYDGNPHAASGTAKGVGGMDLSSSLNFGPTFTNVPGGTANWTFTGGTNYNNASGNVAIGINPRQIEVMAAPKAKTYGDLDPTFTITVGGSGLASGDTIANVFSGTLTRAPGEIVVGSPYAINQGTLVANSNYIVTSFTPSALTIMPKQLLGSITAYSKQYDGNATATIASRILAGALNGDDVIYVGGSATFDDKFAGTNKLVTATGLYLSGAQASNYTVNSTATTYASIAPLGFAGFLSPIGGADSTGGSYVDTIRTIKLGSTLPVKFTTFTDGGSPWLTGIHTIHAIKFSNATTSEAALELTATDTATTGNQFRLTDGQWHFNLSTKTQSGFSKGIWQIVATLEDGTRHFAWIELKP
jgi:YDG domain